MPHLRIETNVQKIPADFTKRAVSVLAKALGKPESYCVVSVHAGVPLSFGGSDEPAAVGNVMSIGQLGLEQNKKHSKVLFKFIEDELGIAPTRMYIVYQDEKSSNVGYNGSTFHDILG